MMLTRRQMWRRASVRKPEAVSAGTPPCSPSNSADDIEHMRESSSSSQTAPTVKTKGVRFSNHVFVVLIPTREELRACNLSLCWTLEEICSFQNDAARDLCLYAELKGVSLAEARRELYQPHPDDLCHSSDDIVIRLRRDSVLKLRPAILSAQSSSQSHRESSPDPPPISSPPQPEEKPILAAHLRQWVIPFSPVYLKC